MQATPSHLRRQLVKLGIIRRFRKKLGYMPNLSNPQSYCEKLQWLKLNYLEHNQLIIQCTDKYMVRDHLANLGLSNLLVNLYGCWDNTGQIHWDALPNEFILKLNNGSGKKYIWHIANKNLANRQQIFREINSALGTRFGYKHGEFHYLKIPPKIIAEEYLKDNNQSFRDYKFYCFNGKIGFLSIETERKTERHVRDYYDIDLNKQPVQFYGDVKKPSQPFDKPRNFADMIDIAQLLSKGHPHIRVDLYNIDGQIYFGELTFAPECGYIKWDPVELDFEYGKLIDMDIANSYLQSITEHHSN